MGAMRTHLKTKTKNMLVILVLRRKKQEFKITLDIVSLRLARVEIRFVVV